jgi:hypothetical protein
MKKLTQKKTCERCRCSQLVYAHGYRCQIGYAVDSDKAIPLEPCPKPLTCLQWARTGHKLALASESKRSAGESADETSGRSAYNSILSQPDRE